MDRALLRLIESLPPARLRESTNELDHFYICETCSQAVDRRSLFQVFHHEFPDHDPLPVN